MLQEKLLGNAEKGEKVNDRHPGGESKLKVKRGFVLVCKKTSSKGIA